MVIVSYRPTVHDVLDCIDDGIRNLVESNATPMYILCGATVYDLLCDALAERLKHSRKNIESYNHIAVLIDPFRDDQVCVLPAPRDILAGIETVIL